MNLPWRLKCFWLISIILRRYDVLAQTRGESSGEYLQKVMIELQEFNVPSSLKPYKASVDYKNGIYGANQNRQMVQRINSAREQSLRDNRHQSLERHAVLPHDKVDLDQAAVKNVAQYYRQPQVSTITKISEPETIGFTRAELAAMYKNALQKGSATSLASLTNALASGEIPNIKDDHLEFPAKQPLYQYYFFPLKTFVSELNKDHGYNTIAASTLGNAEVAATPTETNQMQLSNPLFVAISTFITMAVIFMMGVMFLPRLSHYDALHARGLQEDFHDLSNAINAMDRYEVFEKLENHYFESRRYNGTTKTKKKRIKK